jgi:uncharacterized delta-60 repeat protein
MTPAGLLGSGLALGAVILTGVFGSSPAGASSGLDASFGDRGVAVQPIVDADIRDESFFFAGMTRLSDGSFVGAATSDGLQLARWGPDGRLAGRQGAGGFALSPHTVLARSDGRFVAAGAGAGRLVAGLFSSTLAPDPSFGSAGRAEFVVPGATAPSTRAIVETSRRAVVVGGYAGVGGQWRWLLARLNEDGSLDFSFGSGGVALTAFPGTDERSSTSPGAVARTSINGLASQPDGKLVAVGSVVLRGSHRAVAVVARYLADGRLDPTFARGRGWISLSFLPRVGAEAMSVALWPSPGTTGDQAIVVAGRAGNSRNDGAGFALARLRPDGRLDRSFGRQGIAVTDVGGSNGATAVAVRADDSIVVAGASEATKRLFIVARYTATGRLDRRFGGAGVACPSMPRYTIPPAVAAEVNKTSVFALPDGRTVLGGQVEWAGDLAWILAAYRPAFMTPVGCLAVRTPRHRTASVTVALARRTRLAIDVTQFTVPGGHRRSLGRVDFGTQPRGLRSLPWSLRVRGQAIRPAAADRIYVLTPVTLSRTGRVTSRGSAAFV